MGGKGSNEVKETAHEKELARIATEQWERYETTFKPLEDEWIAGITADTTNDKANIGGMVAGKIGQQYDEAQAAKDKGDLASGMNVNSGTFKQGLSRGEDTGKALTRTNIGVDTRQVGEISNAINVGRGQASQAQASLTDVANQATTEAMKDSRNKYLSRQETGTAIGTVAGMGVRTLEKE